MKYYANKSQEEAVTKKIAEVIESFGFTADTTEKEKCDAIYKYITSHVSYDYENMNDTSYYLKFSTYAALIKQTAVCQGFASLFYRMARDCGLEARSISGKSKGQNHAWNIVKIGGYFYYVDATWDAGQKKYQYYLKGSEDFPSHEPDDKFFEPEFLREYPISVTSYVEGGINENCQLGHSYEMFYEDKIETRYTCKVCGKIKTKSNLPDGETLVKGNDGLWYYYLDGVKTKTTTLVKYEGKWFYIKDGVWNKTANVLFKFKTKWFYIKSGKWNSKHELFFKIGGDIYYIKSGKWNNTLTTLVKHNSKWHYIKKGKFCQENTIVPYKGKKFFVEEGYANLSFSGNVIIDGKKYKIKYGKVV